MFAKVGDCVSIDLALVLHLLAKTCDVIVLLSQHLLLLIEEILQGLDGLVGGISHFLDVFLLLDANTGFIFVHLILEDVILTEILVAKLPFVHRVDF